MKNGQTVAAFEKAFAEYAGAKYAIALCNGTATLHTALVAFGVKPRDRVATTPLTMSATTLAILHAGAIPVYCDVDPDTWLLGNGALYEGAGIAVSLYGLHAPLYGPRFIDDAAQTLRKHSGAAFTSYSFQASKILPLGEGGMLVTDDEELATKAREFSSLGYRMRADQPRIDPDAIKSPTFERHHSIGYNYRMNDLTAAEGLKQLDVMAGSVSGIRHCDMGLAQRSFAATSYREAIKGCPWLTPQHVPEGWTHDYWTFAVAVDTPERALRLSESIVKHGGEKPYPAWRLSYQEPALEHLAPLVSDADPEADAINKFFGGTAVMPKYSGRTSCPIAESLQPRLLQMQTNSLASAERNAAALKKVIEELS